MGDLPRRKGMRLAGFDYGTPGAYFVTICTRNRACILSDIAVGEGLAPPSVTLTEIGKIAEEQLLLLPERFPNMHIDNYVIMPNHIHILATLTGPGGGTLVDAVRVYKSVTARLAGPLRSGGTLFQRSFYDHAVRGDGDFRDIWSYIDGNPGKWQADRFYPSPHR